MALVKPFRESVKNSLKWLKFEGLRQQWKSVCCFTDEPVMSIGWNDFVRYLLRGGRVVCLVTMLVFPESSLESIWRLKPEARNEFEEIGRGASIVLTAAIGTACGLAAVGLAQAAKWGRWLAIGILTANLIGDSVNALLRHDPKTLIGLPIAGLMIWYLVKTKVSAEK